MYELPTQEEANEYLSANGPWDMQEHFGITKYDANRLILKWFEMEKQKNSDTETK